MTWNEKCPNKTKKQVKRKFNIEPTKIINNRHRRKSDQWDPEMPKKYLYIPKPTKKGQI